MQQSLRGNIYSIINYNGGWNYGASVFYGAGQVGKLAAQSINQSIKLIGFIDSRAQELTKVNGYPVFLPDVLRTAQFDGVVITVGIARLNIIYEILSNLKKLEVPWEKISIYQEPNNAHEINCAKRLTPDIQSEWDDYYEIAEKGGKASYEYFIKPYIEKHEISLESVLDFPCNRGRIAAQFCEIANSVTCVDSNAEAIGVCKKRFNGLENYFYSVNKVDGNKTLPLDIPDDSFSFIYSFDAMVHFDYKWLDFYISEFKRICKVGGYVLMHHSN